MKATTLIIASLFLSLTTLAALPTASAIDTGVCVGPVELSDCDSQVQVCHDSYDEIICVKGPIQCITNPCFPFPPP